MTLISTVGGASGPLYGTLFLGMAAAAAGKLELTLADWIAAFEAGVAGVMRRGKAALGDKTMIDCLAPAVDALKAAAAEGAERRAARPEEAGRRAWRPDLTTRHRSRGIRPRSPRVSRARRICARHPRQIRGRFQTPGVPVFTAVQVLSVIQGAGGLRTKARGVMVGLVIVSHSARLAEGVAELARGVGGADLALAATGGLDLPGQPLGTDALLVLRAIEAVYADDGVVVLMDLGSAVLSAELALDLLPAERRDHVVLCEAPLVEGAVAAAVQARLGSPLPQVLAEARGALAAKAAHLGAGTPEPAIGSGRQNGGRRHIGGRRPERDARAPPARAECGRPARPPRSRVRANRRQIRGCRHRAVEPHRGPRPRGRQEHQCGDHPRGPARGRDPADRVRSRRPGRARRAGEDRRRACGERDSRRRTVGRAGTPRRRRQPHKLASPGDPCVAGHCRWTVHPYPAAQPPGSVLAPPDAQPGPAAADPQAEWAALQAALARTAGQIRATRDAVAVRAGRAAAEIFEAQLLFLGDDALLAPVRSAIFEGGLSAAAAWQAAVDRVAERYAALDDEALRSRRADLVDVGRQVLANLSGAGLNLTPAPFAGPGILVARELSPTEAAHLDPDTVLGVCTALGGPTSHAAILARALGIPYVAGLGEAILALSEGAPAGHGRRCGRRLAASAARSRRRMCAARGSRPCGPGGSAARECPARGHPGRPSRRDRGQYRLDPGRRGRGGFRRGRRRAVSHGVSVRGPPGSAGGGWSRSRPIARRPRRWVDVRWSSAPSTRAATNPCPTSTCRLKPTPSWAGEVIRLCLAQPEIFTVQLRAIVRVAAEHPVKVMFPMIATLGEWRAAVALLAAARGEVLARGDHVRDHRGDLDDRRRSRQGSWSRSRPRRCWPGNSRPKSISSRSARTT